MKFFNNVLPLIYLVSLGGFLRSEEISINLGSAQREPLVEILYPPPNSKDRLTFGSGMQIRQRAGTGGEETGLIGCRTLLSASGDFSAQLALQVIKLEPPEKGDGQGLNFLVVLDDPEEHHFGLSQVASSDGSLRLIATKTSNGTQQERVALDRTIKAATFEIRRSGSEMVLSVIEKGTVEDVARFESPLADLGSVEMWSTRVPEKNGESNIVFKRLKIESDEFYASKEPPQSWLAPWQISVIVFLVAISILVFIPRK